MSVSHMVDLEVTEQFRSGTRDGGAAHAERFLTIGQFNDLTNTSRSFAYGEIGAGRLKVIKLGRLVRISERAYAEWVETHMGGEAASSSAA